MSLFFGKSTTNYAENLKRFNNPVDTIYVSTYIPRKCGIATFTKDLTNAINMINPLRLSKIAAMDNKMTESVVYPHEVEFRIREDNYKDYKDLARYINENAFDLVSIQHEFGIFGGTNGELVLPFLDEIKKPAVVTLHTVLEFPTSNQREIIQKICRKARAVVVMLDAASEILNKVYGVEKDKIVMIRHGVPDFPRLQLHRYKKKFGLSRRTVMTSVNLISPSRGFEYAIEAVPKIVKKVPNFLYLIIGETHPLYLKENNWKDPYRGKLLKLVKKLKVENHVRFVNKYVSLKRLVSYIGASDFYVTPYLNPEQIASGSLSYAIGAGTACISTPYRYAKEMLCDGRGVIVPFQNGEAISDVVIRLVEDPEERETIEARVYETGRTMTWINIAHQYYHIFKFVTDGH